jgi:hypothetical protein
MAVTHGKLGNVSKWNGTALDLAAEACTEAAATAQITDTAKRILNPNCTDLVFTDSGGETIINIDYAQGLAYFSGAVTVVTCTGTGAYVPTGNLVKTAQLFEWSVDFALTSHDITEFQDDWQRTAGGIVSASGSAQGFMAGSNWWDDIEDETDDTMKYWFLELFSYDPDDDLTGDSWRCWALFNAMNANIPIGEYVRETIGFDVHTYPHFVANV